MTDKAQQDEEGDALTTDTHETMRIIDDEAEALSAEALSIRAAGGFKKWAAMRRPECVAFNAKRQGRRTVQVQWASIAHSLACMAYEERLARTPVGWAWAFSEELRLNNPGMDKATQGAAEAQIMSTFEAQADTLPLRQAPSGLQWPKGQPLPPKWRDGMHLKKTDLRAWAAEHCPDLQGSALLAESQGTPAGETWLDGEVAAEFIECANNEGEPINWLQWVADMPALEAADAARLMAGLEPTRHKSLETRRNDSVGVAKERARNFLRKAAAQSIERRSPAEWLVWADGLKDKTPVHVGFRLAVEQHATAPAEQAATVAAQGTPAEQWEAAKGDTKRRAELAAAMVRECHDNKTEAARRLGTHRQTIDRVLGKSAAHSAAGAAPMYAQLARKPHKT